MQIIKLQIICIVGDIYVAYHKGSLLISRDLIHFEHLCDIPMTVMHRVLASFSMSARLFRLYPRAVCVLGVNTFIFGFCGRVFFVNIPEKSISTEHIFPSPMKTPLSFTKVEGVKGFDDCVIYGEYHANPHKREMGVYSRRNGEWKRVCSFRADEILHIHGFCVDKVNSRVLILTGDSDKESIIFEAKDNFTDIKPLLYGSQKYRSCVAFADKGDLVFATDTPQEPNAIYRYHNESVEMLYNMPGPSIFGTIIERDGEKIFVFSTSVEPDSRVKGNKYWITSKLGPGVKDRYCNIVIGNVNNGFKTIARFEKDWLPMTAFQFGNASFTEGVEDTLFVLPQSVKHYNGKTLIFKNIWA